LQDHVSGQVSRVSKLLFPVDPYIGCDLAPDFVSQTQAELRTVNTGLFIVYNVARGFGVFDGEQPNRSLLIKYSHLFDVF